MWSKARESSGGSCLFSLREVTRTCNMKGQLSVEIFLINVVYYYRCKFLSLITF